MKMSNQKVTPINKDIWFLVKIKSNIEYLENNLKRYSERISLIEFDTIDDADDYFSLLENSEDLQFSIINDYIKNG